MWRDISRLTARLVRRSILLGEKLVQFLQVSADSRRRRGGDPVIGSGFASGSEGFGTRQGEKKQIIADDPTRHPARLQ